ncbi:DUF3306 domain-containing protein [Pelagibius sp. CAU 1746]|uniref:DUF3306 domain-containing protein n=1 Tax=Pelagibius sp. CAU 1746 TaxID=3140370 RepID=UPI00325B6096
MTKEDRDGGKAFLSRWSQRKREAAEAELAQDGTKPGDAPADLAAAGQEALPEEGRAPIEPADLPDIDSLDAESDFTVFLQDGVPDALRRRALRKLWRLDPVFGHLDGLNDYDLDYTDAATVVAGLKTIYQVGKGMVLGEDEEEAEKAEERAVEATAGTAPAPAGASGAEESGDAAAGDPGAASDLSEPQGGEGAPPEVGGGAGSLGQKARNPGEPLAAAAPARRHGGARAPQRSASQRRWGEPTR